MPFKVTYSLYEPDKVGAVLTTTDAKFARLELAGMQAKPELQLSHMTTDVELVEPTKPEEYTYLVYTVRKAIKHYYAQRGHVPKEVEQQNLKASLALEKKLDLWNATTRFYLQRHPKSTPDDPQAFAFFQLVEAWRNKWHQYFAYRRDAKSDKRVLQMMRRECQDYETQIDNYVKQTIGI